MKTIILFAAFLSTCIVFKDDAITPPYHDAKASFAEGEHQANAL